MKVSYAEILRPAFGDCTNNGISSKCDMMYVFDECTIMEALDYCEKKNIAPVECLIAEHEMFAGHENLYLVPLNKKRKGYIGPMNGGNYAYCRNEGFPRYADMPNVSVPLRIHDRYETQEEYDLYSM